MKSPKKQWLPVYLLPKYRFRSKYNGGIKKYFNRKSKKNMIQKYFEKGKCILCNRKLEKWQIERNHEVCKVCFHKTVIEEDNYGKDGCCLTCLNNKPNCLCEKMVCYRCVWYYPSSKPPCKFLGRWDGSEIVNSKVRGYWTYDAIKFLKRIFNKRVRKRKRKDIINALNVIEKLNKSKIPVDETLVRKMLKKANIKTSE